MRETIRAKWQNIEDYRVPPQLNITRFDDECIPNFYIGIINRDSKCILHHLDNVHIDFRGFEKNNLRAYKIEDYLILELTENEDFFELFLDLSCAIFNTIRGINVQQRSAEIFKEMILKWSTFFSDKKNYKLGEKEIIGLFGELYVLRSFIVENVIDTNEILKAWKGPFGSDRDFEFSTKQIEVKTIKQDGEYVDISSEFQLSINDGAELDLRVLKVRQDVQGLSLKDIVDDVIAEIILRNSQVELFYSALYQVNVVDLQEYDHYRFAVNSDISYDVNHVDFPKLTEKDLPDGISKVKYRIALSEIGRFVK